MIGGEIAEEKGETAAAAEQPLLNDTVPGSPFFYRAPTMRR